MDQHRVSEGIVTHSSPRDKCLLCIDFATYDETLLVVPVWFAYGSSRSCPSV